MAYGYNNNNNTNRDQKEGPSVYSPYRLNNHESSVDQTCLTFSMWNRSLKLSINPRKQTGNDDVSFDMNAGVTLYLSHVKARMLHTIIKKFREDPETYNNCGVSTNKGLITICNGKEYNTTNPCLVARAIDRSGMVTAEFIYETRNDGYYYAISNFSNEDGSYNKISDDFLNIELDMIENMLEQYYNAMTMAVAFTVIDQNKIEMSRLNGKIESIGNKLGVEFGHTNTGNGNRYRNQSYFNNSEPGNASTFTPASLAELDDDDDMPI